MHIHATVAAADDVAAEVSVILHNGDLLLGTHYSLTGGDALSACVRAECRPLARDLTSQNYDAEPPYVAETPYVISLTRQVAASAPNSVVTLPVPFAILAPPPGLRVTDGEHVTVQWSPVGAGELVGIDGEARCDHEDGARTTRLSGPLGRNVGAGTATVAVDAFFDRVLTIGQSTARVLRCDLVLEVKHERRGTGDTRFGGALLMGRVTRKVTLDYTPSQG